MLTPTPKPPYYAVIFTSKRTEGDGGYSAMAEKMEALAKQQPGFLGMEHARDAELGITVSYFTDEASIVAWKKNVEHLEAQRQGRERWYEAYDVRVAKVERAYSFAK
ncbi:MAG: antibiotic biosynthesis monooxygenase [Archangium sp.]